MPWQFTVALLMTCSFNNAFTPTHLPSVFNHLNSKAKFLEESFIYSFMPSTITAVDFVRREIFKIKRSVVMLV